MRIGPSQRVRSAGEVRCAQTTDGSAASVVSMSKATSASGDVQASLAALRLPASLEIQGECVDVAEMLDRLLAGSKPQRLGVEPEGIDGRGREEREAVGPRLGGAGALQQPVDDDDVRPGQLVPAGDTTPDERAVVDEQLEVEPGSQPARIAVAGRRLVDAPQPAPKGEVGRLDRVEQEGPVGAPILDEQERRIALELGQPERRLQAADDRLEEVAGDGRRVLHLAARQVGGVAGQVGDDEETGSRVLLPWHEP